jgi:hypothetical protein
MRTAECQIGDTQFVTHSPSDYHAVVIT